MRTCTEKREREREREREKTKHAKETWHKITIMQIDKWDFRFSISGSKICIFSVWLVSKYWEN
jgi:hypothetical protein